MAAKTRKFLKLSVSQNVRDRNARQLRSDFLVSMFKTFFGTIRERSFHSASEVRANT